LVKEHQILSQHLPMELLGLLVVVKLVFLLLLGVQ
jgi:hypothetical protein